jgi:membrane protein
MERPGRNTGATFDGERREPRPAILHPIIVQPALLNRLWWLLRRAFIAAYEDNCFSIAKGAAYSFLLSLFPVLTTLTAILIQVRAQKIVHVIATFVSQVAPPGTEDLIFWRLRQNGRPVTLSVAAVLLALWAGSGAMMSLMEGFQAAYRIPSGRPFLKQRAMSVFLVLIAAVPSVLASALIIFGDRSVRTIMQWVSGASDVIELSAPVEMAWRFGRYVVAFGATTLVTGLLYYFGPNHRPEWTSAQTLMESRFMRVWPGAFVATTLWLAATLGFAWYVGHIAHYNILYGSIWAVIVLLIWLYLIACIALVGCEFNAERERLDALPMRPESD